MQSCLSLGFTFSECIGSVTSDVGPLLVIAVLAVGAWLMQRR